MLNCAEEDHSEVSNDPGMKIEFVKVQCTISTQGVEKWIWLTWLPKRKPSLGDIRSDHTWYELKESQLSESDWADLRDLVGSREPSVVSGGGVNDGGASWRRWHIRHTDGDWNMVPESEAWPKL